MKKAIFFFLLLFFYSYSSAQIPHTISYQGILTDNKGNPVPDGNVSLIFRLYDASEGGDTLWQERQQVAVSKGIFNVVLGSVETLSLPFDQQYWLGITTDGNEELTPRIALTASPYSLNSANSNADPEPGQNFRVRNINGEVTHNLISNGDAKHSGTSTFDGGIRIKAGTDSAFTINYNNGYLMFEPDTQSTSEPNQINKKKDGKKLAYLIKKVRISDTFIYTPVLRTSLIRANDDRATSVISGVNIGKGPAVSGYSVYSVGIVGQGNPGVWSQGKLKVDDVPAAPNQERFLVWDADSLVKYRTIPQLGDAAWKIDGSGNLVASGHNVLIKDAHGNITTSFDTNGTSMHTGLETFKAGIKVGGSGITISDIEGQPAITIGGETPDIHTTGKIKSGNSITVDGINHIINSDVDLRFDLSNNQTALRLEPNSTSPNIIGGFADNDITSGVTGAVISGGGIANEANLITDNYGTIGGGIHNQAGDNTGTVDDAHYATVGGGRNNKAVKNFATVAGGEFNAANEESSAILGGDNNTVNGTSSSIAGGDQNIVDGTNSFIGGGSINSAAGFWASLGGGESNSIKALTEHATIGGGKGNSAQGSETFIGGGESNQALGPQSTIGGGFHNTASGQYSIVAGGNNNQATAQYNGTIAGGSSNTASGNWANINGGVGNTASAVMGTIGGGQGNTASGDRAVVGGGLNNTASGLRATVPGGEDNIAAGDYSFAAGQKAKINSSHNGTFLFADANQADFNSASANEFAVRATGGVRFVTAINGTTPTAGVQLAPGGSSWLTVSDRNAKTNFTHVDKKLILERLSEISIDTWNYKTQDNSIRHIGPMAQDFYKAFNVGEDNKHINTVDADGVALAAIQGLYQLLKDKDSKIEELNSTNKKLEKRINDLDKKLEKLEILFSSK
jgi:trimeric autotransporter adhesin